MQILSATQFAMRRWLGLILPLASIGFILFGLMMILSHLSHRASQDQLERDIEVRLLENARFYAERLEAELLSIQRLGMILVKETERRLNPLVRDDISTPVLPYADEFMSLLASIHAQYPLIKQLSIHAPGKEMLIYPWRDAAASYTDLYNTSFFYLANPVHNPHRQAIWTEARHIDSVEPGWVVTLSLPVYADTQFIAVVRLDIALDVLIQALRPLPVAFGGHTLLLSPHGQLLVSALHQMDAQSEALSRWPKQDFFLHQGLSAELTPLHTDAAGLLPLVLFGQASLISWSTLSTSGWKLLLVVPRDGAYALSDQWREDWMNMLGSSLLTLMVMLLCLIFFARRHDDQRSMPCKKEITTPPTVACTEHTASQQDVIAAAEGFIQQVSGPLLICHFDLQGRILQCNTAFEHFAQETQASLKTQPLAPLLGMRDLPPRPWVQELALHSAGEEASSWWASLHAANETSGYLLMLDISDYRQLQHQLHSERQRARLATKMKSEFSRAVAREAERLLLDLQEGARAMNNLSCQQKLTAIQRLLDDLSDMSENVQAEEDLNFQAEPVDMTALIQEVVKSLEPLLDQQQRQLNIHYDASLPEQLLVHRRRLTRLIRHILRQALQLSEQGHIQLHLSWQADDALLLLQVTDQQGALTTLQKSQRFQQLSNSPSGQDRSASALGLGQLLTRQLIQEMKGQIELSTSAEGGIQLDVLLPAPSVVKQAVLPRILVVDDGPVNSLLASNALEKSGYRVDSAQSGAEALQLAHQHHYNLVLMDIFMPEMDGLETTRRWRQLNHPNASIPILAVTANALDADQQDFYAAGLNDYLAKPYRPAELRQLVEKWLQAATTTSVSSVSSVESVNLKA